MAIRSIIGTAIITGATGVMVDNPDGLFTGNATLNGAGDYTFTMTKGYAANEINVIPVQVHGAIRGGVAVEKLTATTFRVRCVDAGGVAASPTQLQITVIGTKFRG